MGEDELICDLAETYGILDYRRVPPSLVSTLFFGLSDNSRIKRKLSGSKLTLEESLLAVIADRLGFLCWAQTKDAQKGKNQPTSIYESLTKDTSKEDDVVAFDSIEDFFAERERILNGN